MAADAEARLRAVGADLAAEVTELDAAVAGLAPGDWDMATPAEGWTVRDQVIHLAYVDHLAVLAIADPPGFQAERARIRAAAGGLDGTQRRAGAGRSDAELLAWWRDRSARLAGLLSAAAPGLRVEWTGPSMSVTSLATARLMETWCHGQDVVDALGLRREPTDRLRHVAHLGVATRAYSFGRHGLGAPDADVHVSLRAPSGERWSWGDPAAADQISGDALDFALVVTRRRNVADVGLRVRGEVASRWMEIAQAYAGPPGEGRAPGSFARG